MSNLPVQCTKGKTREREHRGVKYQISPAHPAAELLPWLGDDDLDALAADIKTWGQRDDIRRLPDLRILDGRNRELACLVAGVEPRYAVIDEDESSYPMLVASWNIHRRHLTAEHKRELAAAILRAAPAKSNRAVAAAVGIDHKTAGGVRRELESGGEIPHLDDREGRDGKTYPTATGASRTTAGDKLGKAREAVAELRAGLVTFGRAVEVLLGTPVADYARQYARDAGIPFRVDEVERHRDINDIATRKVETLPTLTKLGAWVEQLAALVRA